MLVRKIDPIEAKQFGYSKSKAPEAFVKWCEANNVAVHHVKSPTFPDVMLVNTDAGIEIMEPGNILVKEGDRVKIYISREFFDSFEESETDD